MYAYEKIKLYERCTLYTVYSHDVKGSVREKLKGV